MRIVLDASVILKLVRTENEQDQKLALDILRNFQTGKVDVVLPNFWLFEVGNTLVVKDTENFESLYEFLLDVGFPIYDFTDNELVGIGKFAKNHQVSFYDASYHFLAKLTNSTFVTADEKYFEKVKEVGNIDLLKNLKLT